LENREGLYRGLLDRMNGNSQEKRREKCGGGVGEKGSSREEEFKTKGLP